MTIDYATKSARAVSFLLFAALAIVLLLAAPSGAPAGNPAGDAAWGLLREAGDASRSGGAPCFGPDGTMRAVAAPAERSGGKSAPARAFLPNIRVDDDIDPEHREPAVAWGPGHTMYALYCERATHYNPEYVMFTRSGDGGLTWLPLAVRVNDTSPNAVVFPAVDVMDDGTIVAVWSEMKFSPYNYEIRFSRSSDGGDTWSASAVVHPIDPSTDYHRPSILVAGGRILVSFWQEVSYPNGYPVLVTSDDGGATWSAPLVITNTLCRYDGSAPCLAENDGTGDVGVVLPTSGPAVHFCGSSDSGMTWSAPVQVSDAVATSINYPDLEGSGGLFHVVWSDNRNGQYDTDVWASRSADGVTFTPSVRVNDFYAGNQYEPHIRAGSDGILHVCWIWNLPFQSNIDLFYSSSGDNGQTWLATSPRVNDTPYVVQPYVAWTSDLLADGAGAYLFWNDGRATGYYDNIYFTTNAVPTGVASGPAPMPAATALLPNGPNPFNPATVIRFTLVEEEHARLTVHDVRGRRVALLADRVFGAGESRLSWDGRDESGRDVGSGVYLVRLVAGNFDGTRRITLLR